MAQRLKPLPARRETWVQSLGREDPLEKEMATHSSILAWKIPWKEEPGRFQSTGSQRVGNDWATSLYSYAEEEPPFMCHFKSQNSSLQFWLWSIVSLAHTWKVSPSLIHSFIQKMNWGWGWLALSHMVSVNEGWISERGKCVSVRRGRGKWTLLVGKQW